MTRSTIDGADVVRAGRVAGAADGDVAAYVPLRVDATGSVIVGNFPATQPVSGALTNAELRALAVAVADPSVVPIRTRFEAKLTSRALYTTAGTATLVAAGAAERARVTWVYAQAKASLGTGAVTVTVTLGTLSYQFELTGSQPFAHGVTWEGALGDDLTVTLDSAAEVLVNVDYLIF